MMRGHFAYYGVGGNIRRLRGYAHQAVRIWKKWLSRRDRQSVVPWTRLNEILNRHPRLAKDQPRIRRRERTSLVKNRMREFRTSGSVRDGVGNVPIYSAMTHSAMATICRGLLRGGTPERLDAWLLDARAAGIYAMQRFARTIRQDLDAVRNAVLEPWSNGQTEGQINKLKTLKRAMYGRAGVDLLRARMLPLQEASLHQE